MNAGASKVADIHALRGDDDFVSGKISESVWDDFRTGSSVRP
jgi:hypothetical protein